MAKITTTFLLPSATLEALSDELQKIAADEGRKEKVKKWLKNTALISAGVGAGTAATMGIDKLVGSKLGPTWQSISPNTKKLVLGPLLGLSALGSRLVAKKLHEEMVKSRE